MLYDNNFLIGHNDKANSWADESKEIKPNKTDNEWRNSHDGR